MFGGLGVCVVARQSLRVSSDTSLLLLLLQELGGRRREECHVIHGTHRLHLSGDEVRGGERAVPGDGLPLQGAVQVFQEEGFQGQGARSR